MLALLAALFIIVPIIELYVIIQVGQEIGVWYTLLAMILISVIGAWLAKHEGTWVIAKIRGQLEAGQVPTNELIDGFLVLVGGIFLLVPGFISDLIGIFLLFPPTRIGIRKLIRGRLWFVSLIPNRFPRRGPSGGPVDGPPGSGPDDVIDV